MVKHLFNKSSIFRSAYIMSNLKTTMSNVEQWAQERLIKNSFKVCTNFIFFDIPTKVVAKQKVFFFLVYTTAVDQKGRHIILSSPKGFDLIYVIQFDS